MSRLSDIEIFAQVVSSESFSGAARELDVSKSHVSKRVRALEDRLGARLLNRTTRRLSLTDVGKAFHGRCARVLADLDEAELAVTSMQTAPRGVLRLSVPLSFGVRYGVDAIADYVAEHEELELDLNVTDRFVDIVDDGYDVALRISVLEDSTLVARRIAPVDRFIVGSPEYFERFPPPETIDDLREHQCMQYRDQSTWRFQGPNGTETVRIQGRIRADNGDAIVELCRRGVGLALVPDFLVATEVHEGTLVPVLGAYSKWSALYAVYPHSRHLSAKVRTFVDFMVERFRDPPWACK